MRRCKYKICGKDAALGHTRCEDHLREHRDTARSLAASRKAAGLCAECGEPAVTKTLCDKHSRRGREACERLREKRKAEGLCLDCGKRAADEGHRLCFECLEIHRERGVRRTKSFTELFGIAKANARARDLLWTISFEEYKALRSSPCHYCGLPHESDENGTGLDRLNNNEGYHLVNVVSCCAVCNIVRGKMFTVDEMKYRIGPIIREIKLERRVRYRTMPRRLIFKEITAPPRTRINLLKDIRSRSKAAEQNVPPIVRVSRNMSLSDALTILKSHTSGAA